MGAAPRAEDRGSITRLLLGALVAGVIVLLVFERLDTGGSLQLARATITAAKPAAAVAAAPPCNPAVPAAAAAAVPAVPSLQPSDAASDTKGPFMIVQARDPMPGHKRQVLKVVMDYNEVFQDVYEPNKYKLCSQHGFEQTWVCWLSLWRPVDCKASFEDYLKRLKANEGVWPPPRAIPDELKDIYLLSGHIEPRNNYHAQQGYEPGAAVQIWDQAMISRMTAEAAERPQNYGNYGFSVQHIYRALQCHPMTGQHVAVFGSMTPWLEAVLLSFGARQVTTVEYRPTRSTAQNLTAMTPREYAEGWLNGSLTQVDAAASYSSWEHDGLGRYGDPLNPWGDVQSMERASCFVKPGGLLFFGAPTSWLDQLHWNAHRVYGPVRLPLMTANWKVLGVYDSTRASMQKVCGLGTCGHFMTWMKEIVPYGGHGSYGYHPVIVLQNQRTTPCGQPMPAGAH